MKNSLRATFKRGSMAGVATAGAAALLLTGCGAAPEASTATNTASNYKGCIVSDSGGFDDQSFNQSSYEGLKEADEELGIKTSQAESKTNNDFEPQPRAMVAAGCNLIITVGFLLGDATKAPGHREPGQALRHHRLRLRNPASPTSSRSSTTPPRPRSWPATSPPAPPRPERSPPSAASRSPRSPSSWTASPTA